jgi:hypothetical protein
VQEWCKPGAPRYVYVMIDVDNPDSHDDSPNSPDGQGPFVKNLGPVLNAGQNAGQGEGPDLRFMAKIRMGYQ